MRMSGKWQTVAEKWQKVFSVRFQWVTISGRKWQKVADGQGQKVAEWQTYIIVCHFANDPILMDSRMAELN